jgi:uncharacterized protein YdbL (DUF1318 family)
VDGATARKILAICSHMEARSEQIAAWKKSGTVGESAAGLLEIRDTADANAKKEMQPAVNSENTERSALYQELARVYKLGDDKAASIGQSFARVYRQTAAENFWVQNPADNRWVLKKELNE